MQMASDPSPAWAGALQRSARVSLLAYRRPGAWSIGRDAHGTVHVAFKGTTRLADVPNVIDVRAIERTGRHGAVHAGFLRRFAAVEDAVRKATLRCLPAKNVTFTGHSMGGALALFAAVTLLDDLRDAGVRNVQCHVFGTPRVATPEFASAAEDALGDGLWNVHVDGDIVPMLPTNPRFRHVGNVLEIREDDDGRPIAACALDDGGECRAEMVPRSVDELMHGHSMVTYARFLTGIVSQQRA